MKNTLKKMNYTLNEAEDQISNLENKTQSDLQNEKKIFK